ISLRTPGVLRTRHPGHGAWGVRPRGTVVRGGTPRAWRPGARSPHPARRALLARGTPRRGPRATRVRLALLGPAAPSADPRSPRGPPRAHRAGPLPRAGPEAQGHAGACGGTVAGRRPRLAGTGEPRDPCRAIFRGRALARSVPAAAARGPCCLDGQAGVG